MKSECLLRSRSLFFCYDIIDNKYFVAKGADTIKPKINFDKKYLKLAIYAMLVLAFAIGFNKLLENIVPLLGGVGKGITILGKLVRPFIYGFFIAYILNPIVMLFQSRLFGKIPRIQNKERLCRLFSIILTYVIVLGGIGCILYYLIPEIFLNISNLLGKIPSGDYVYHLDTKLYEFIDFVPYIDPETIQEGINSFLNPLLEKIQDLPSFIETFINSSVLAATTVFNFVFGILLAFYMLYEKENFKKYSTKCIYTFFKKESADFIMTNLRRINAVYADFILGKAVDSLIIGIICFIGVKILNMPYGLLISIIVGVTNMIPYFGPFIGAIPSIAIVFLVDPLSSLVLMIFIFLLQQFDGNILGPKILSVSVGMSPLWIIFSITIGSAVAGVWGMFLGVPTVAVFKMFIDEAINRKYKKKYPDGITEEAVGEEAILKEEVQ